MASEREEVRTTYIHDGALRAGCNGSWGVGNQIFIFAGGDSKQEVKPSGAGAAVANIHEVRWNTDMHGPLTRKLVNETHNIFLKLQKHTPEVQSTARNPQLVKFSREYRSVIKACLIDLQTALKRSQRDEEKKELEAQLQLFDMAELVWSLSEILFIDSQPSGSVLGQLLEWLRWHFVDGERLAHEVMQHEPPQDHPNYWDAVYSFVLQGRVEEARKMLSRHSSITNDSFITMDTLLRKMPLFALFNGQSLGEFELKWRHWQEECVMRLESGDFATDSHLQTICRVLCGETQVLLELSDLCESWYCMLVTRLLYHNPTVKSTDVQYHTQFCIDAYGGNHCLQPWDNVLLAALEFNIHQVIREASTSCGNWWFVAHLADLLHHCNILDSQTLFFGSNLREFLLLEYATSLMSHHSLWQIGIDYLDHCPQFGRPYLEHFVEHLPLETEKKAHKVLRLCEHRGMTDQVRSICKVVGMKALHSGRLGSALSWALRSKDVAFITFLAERFLTEYGESGDFSNLDLIDHLESSMLLSSKLTFLGKYREFHRLYEDGDFAAAASLLLSLLTAKLAPKKFWLTLLTDALPLLEADEVIFSSQQTYELMHCLEELGLEGRLAAKRVGKEKQKMQTETEEDKLELLKLALARNLARATVSNGSLKV